MRCASTIALLALLAAGCGGDDEVLVDARYTGFDAPSNNTADARPAADASPSDAAATDAVTTDADTTDADTTPDAVVFDAMPPGDAMACNSGSCASANATPAGGQKVIIEEVDIAANQITVRNVSGGSLDISGWSLSQGPGLQETIGTVSAMADDTTATLTVSNGLGVSSELGIYEAGDFTSSTDIRAYVRWGAANNTTPSVRESVATGASPPLWTAGDFVDVTCATAGGFVATGNVAQAAGFTALDASCF
jgi:hypothetical protein